MTKTTKLYLASAVLALVGASTLFYACGGSGSGGGGGGSDGPVKSYSGADSGTDADVQIQAGLS